MQTLQKYIKINKLIYNVGDIWPSIVELITYSSLVTLEISTAALLLCLIIQRKPRTLRHVCLIYILMNNENRENQSKRDFQQSIQHCRFSYVLESNYFCK